MARQFAVGGLFGGGYVVDAEDRDYLLRDVYLSQIPTGGPTNVSVNAVGQELTAYVGTPTVNTAITVTGQQVSVSVGSVSVTTSGNISVSAVGQQLTADVGQVAISLPKSVNASGQQMTASVGTPTVRIDFSFTASGQQADVSVGTVSVSAGGGVSVNVSGQELTAEVGTIPSVTGVANVSVTGQQLTASVSEVTARSAFGSLLGSNLAQSTGSITNPFLSSVGQASVIAGDLVYVTVVEQVNLTVTAVADNLGNTYTALNAGSDAGAVTGRAFYSIVTVPGQITLLSATATASSNDAIIMGQAFQGPFSAIDINAANSVNADLVSPYNGPPTGTLAQIDELLVGWAARPDSVNFSSTAPLLQIGQRSTSNIRAVQSYQLPTSTSTITPQWQSASDPAQIITATTTFRKTALPVSTDITGQQVDVSVGTVQVAIDGVIVGGNDRGGKEGLMLVMTRWMGN